MARITSIMIIVSAILFAQAYEDLSDVFRLKTYIKKGDTFRLDLMRLMSFYSTSINFSRNNDKVVIPGIPPETVGPHGKVQVFFPEQKLDPKIFKTESGHMILVSKDDRTLKVFRTDSENEITEIPSIATTFFAGNEKLRIADLVIDHKSNLCALYYNTDEYLEPKDQNTETTYHLFAINFASNNFLFDLPITAPYFAQPTIKMMTRNVDDVATDPSRQVLLVFGKDDEKTAKFSRNIRFKLFTIHNLEPQKPEDPKFEVEQEQIFDLRDVIFDRKTTDARLLNIMVASQHTRQIFFVVDILNSDSGSKKHVYHSAFAYTPLVKNLQFQDSKLFIKPPVVQFFMKEALYVYITKDMKFQMCNAKTSSCKPGNLQRDWAIKRILFEQEHAVIVMSIKQTNVIFINDFTKNIMTWFYDSLAGVKSIFLSHSAYNNDKRLFLAQFLKDGGFKLRDVTLKTMLEVQESDLVDLQPVSLRLDDEELVRLDIARWGGDHIVDTFDDRTIEILKTDTGRFRTRLGYAGKNMLFQDVHEDHQVKYFNRANFELKLEDPASLNKKPFFFHQNWLFFNEQFVRLNCKADKDKIVLNCDQAEQRNLNEAIVVAKITQIVEVGDLFVLLADESKDIRIFDVKTKKIVNRQPDPRFDDGNGCAVTASFLVCKYENKDVNIQSLRLFDLSSGQPAELVQFERDLIELLKPEFGRKRDEVLLSAITISHYGFDAVETNNLSVLFAFVFDVNFESLYFSFRLSYNPNQKDSLVRLSKVSDDQTFLEKTSLAKNVRMFVLDSQLVFASFDEKFSMVCFDGTSTYGFDYIDVQEKPVDMVVLQSHNLVGFVYKRHVDQQYYFTLYRITQNAVKQFVRSEQIENYDKNYRLAFHLVDADTLVVLQYNMENNQVFRSYMYFLDGPILVSRRAEQAVVVDNVERFPNFIEDKLFNVNRFKFEKDNKIEIAVNQDETALNVSDYARFIGNVKDLELAKDHAGRANLKIHKPLTQTADDKLDSVASEEDFASVFVKETAQLTVYRTAAAGNLYTVMTKGKNPKTLNLKFQLAEESTCYDLEASDVSLLCFWTKKGQEMVSVLLFEGGKPQEDFIIPRRVSSVRVMEENANFVSFIYKDDFGKFVGVCRIDKAERSVDIRYIGKRELNIDDLRIRDFHFSLNIMSDRLTVIMLDGLGNQLLFFYAAYKSFSQLYTLKRAISLNELDTAFLQLDCDDLDRQNYKFNCFLYSATHIFQAKIKKNENAKNSEFKWDFTVQKSFYNVLYESSLDEDFALWTQSTKNNLFIYENDVAHPNGNQLVMYNLVSAGAKYSQYVLGLPDMDRVVRIAKEEGASDFLKVFYLRNKELRVRRFLIDDFRLEIKDLQAMHNDNVDMVVHFMNKNHYHLKFYFEKLARAETTATQSRNAVFVILVAGIVVVSVLILCSLLAIIVLLRERKKDSLRMNMMMDNTQNQSANMSYM